MSSLTFLTHSGSGPLHSCWFWTNFGLGPLHGGWGLHGPLGIGQIEVNAFCRFREVIRAGTLDTKEAEVPRREENDGEEELEEGPKVGWGEELEEGWEEELEQGPKVGRGKELKEGPKVGQEEERAVAPEAELREERPDLFGQLLREAGAGTLRWASCGLMGRASMRWAFLTVRCAIWEHNIKPVYSLI